MDAPANWINVQALLLVVAANSAPVVLAELLGPRYDQPIDGHRVLGNGQRLLGSHKTWRGLAGGILAAGVLGALLPIGWARGAVFGLLALAGDLLSSFMKRRLQVGSGGEVLLLDQLPEVLFPMVFFWDALQLNGLQLLGTTVLFIVLDVLFSRYARGPWRRERREAHGME